MKTAIITGGANGIGRSIVQKLLANDYAVAVIDRDQAAGDALAAANDPARILFFHADIADADALPIFIRAVIERFGGADLLVNNACASRGGILGGCSVEDFLLVQKVAVAAPYCLAKLLLPHFKIGASIINIASTRAFMSQPDTESYSAAKGAIIALTHALAASLAGRVRVNAISPGWIDTAPVPHQHSAPDMRQHPAGRIGTSDDIASAVLYLASEAAGFITGQNLTIDGGMTKLMIYHADHGWTYGGRDADCR